MTKHRMAKKLVKKEERVTILKNILVKFKTIITGTPKLDLHDPECETGLYFQVWITDGTWSWGPSGPCIKYHDHVTIKGNKLIAHVKVKSKKGEIIKETDVPLKCANAKEAIKMMKESI